MKPFQLTRKNKKFAEETAERINKNHPGVAFVKDDACFIDRKYYNKCKKYVFDHCNWRQER